jgi:hypothetical protein
MKANSSFKLRQGNLPCLPVCTGTDEFKRTKQEV